MADKPVTDQPGPKMAPGRSGEAAGGDDFGALERTRGAQLASLSQSFHQLWNLGRNIILVWSPSAKGIEVLVIPHYLVADLAPPADDGSGDWTAGGRGNDWGSRSFIEEVIAGPKQVTPDHLKRISRLLARDAQEIEMPIMDPEKLGYGLIERTVKPYSISYAEDRAVALFDIVGFSLNSPLEQVAQLNSLAYSVNAAHSKMLSKKIDITFARSTTGDGFYVWNRDNSMQANVNLYHFMHLVMADNAIARSKSKSKAVPHLRTCFHIGGHYEFYQSEGLSPTVYSYIVGEVTIELARMIDKALPGQVLVGDFLVEVADPRHPGRMNRIDSIGFIQRTQKTLSNLKGLTLSGEAIDSIKCYLTGDSDKGGNFSIKKYRIADKHGLTRSVFNAKINIYRENETPVFLGVQDSELDHFGEVAERIAYDA